MKTTSASILILLAVTLVLPGCGRPDPDAEVLERLKSEGVDLTKPRTVDFFFYFDKEENAKKAADQILALGFETSISPPHGSQPNWLCHATKSMTPELGQLQGLRRQFDSIASGLGGDYDGWSTTTH